MVGEAMTKIKVGNPANRHKIEQHKFKALKQWHKEELNQSGIYLIENIVNGHKYVGQSMCLLNRKKQHFDNLKCNRHYNPYLQNAFNLYGGEVSFQFEVIEFCPHYQLDEREQYWIELLKPEYNIARNIYEWRYRDNPYVEESYTKPGETFTRPLWHLRVYGGKRGTS